MPSRTTGAAARVRAHRLRRGVPLNDGALSRRPRARRCGARRHGSASPQRCAAARWQLYLGHGDKWKPAGSSGGKSAAGDSIDPRSRQEPPTSDTAGSTFCTTAASSDEPERLVDAQQGPRRPASTGNAMVVLRQPTGEGVLRPTAAAGPARQASCCDPRPATTRATGQETGGAARTRRSRIMHALLPRAGTPSRGAARRRRTQRKRHGSAGCAATTTRRCRRGRPRPRPALPNSVCDRYIDSSTTTRRAIAGEPPLMTRWIARPGSPGQPAWWRPTSIATQRRDGVRRTVAQPPRGTPLPVVRADVGR